MAQTIEQVIQQYEDAYDKAKNRSKSILDNARSQCRAVLTADETKEFESLKAEGEKAKRSLDRLREIKAEEDESDRLAREVHPTSAAVPAQREWHVGDTEGRPVSGSALYGAPVAADRAEWRYADTGRDAAVAKGQSWRDHEAVKAYAERQRETDKVLTGTHGNFAQQLRSLSTTGSSAIVPTEWSFPIIDKARNAAVAFRAGCTLVPMPSKIVQIGRLTTDPTPAFKTEGSPVTASDPAFDYVQLTATSLTALTVASLEFLQDAPNADQIVSDAIAKSMALELDKAVFFGQLGATGTNDEGAAYGLASPYPKGILKNLIDNASGQIVGAFPTNGTAQTAATPWNEMVATYYAVKTQNETPGAIVSNDKLVQQYNQMYTSFNNVIDKPPVLRDVPWLTTNSIPSYTRGTMTSRATDVFVGDFSQVLVGQRMDFTIRVLNERYAENGQVGILSYWRGDVQVARPKALACYRGLQGA